MPSGGSSIRLRYSRAIPLALVCIIFLSATGGYIHGNSLGQMAANHMPLGGLFFLIILIFLTTSGSQSWPDGINERRMFRQLGTEIDIARSSRYSSALWVKGKVVKAVDGTGGIY